MQNSSKNRRDFLKFTAICAGIAPIASSLVVQRALAEGAAPASAPAAAPAPAVAPIGDKDKWGALDPKDAMAQALGYSPDAKKVDAKKWPKWTDKQQCWNCILYKQNIRGTGKKTEGLCGVFEPQKKLVSSYGWCNSWAENKNGKAPV